MSMLLRRSLARAAPRARQFSTTTESATQKAYYEKAEDAKHHAADTADMWRKISFYVCAPGIIVTALWVRNVENEHAAHEEHLKHENGGERPEPPAYEYLNIRHRPFAWGMNSLFYNPKVNKDMSQSE
ncbi:hypothetical protein PHLGIDRAFT_17611 [Phlebiopsis gigantea 11061_1 CR5-6]|uniref:Cytochrome c oxidase subunit 13, mitochondrial n=1 Tax=Phlebiopsis gigantea (strain 11061_1 CR5-6) TaxID=745531 RepID=A0A0C3SFQ6_PHLG1|nr:hypothetical protein PHLGIDRAFT_17611 [Phlebiopsis gigantea 11061_1 CR5-6]